MVVFAFSLDECYCVLQAGYIGVQDNYLISQLEKKKKTYYRSFEHMFSTFFYHWKYISKGHTKISDLYKNGIEQKMYHKSWLQGALKLN